ncbi:Uma2 family endonuclease [Streptomyces lavendulocolor]|uniref:Uma2 family endonuclease n=1 Tax=Streptomyces lavendulocolor TaxID=67316 RepID=UPI0033D7E82B
MTAATVENDPAPETPPTWEFMLNAWRGLDVPEGWRAEIDKGKISLVPPPHRHHNSIAARLQRALYKRLPDEVDIYQTLGVHVAPLDKLYVPDLVVMPVDLVEAADPDTYDPVDASEALLIVEITSKNNATDDRTRKYHAYARALVPMYLLIDRYDTRGAMVTLFTDPQDGTYKQSEQVPFGKVLSLPEPFGVTVDTAAFPGGTAADS